MLATAAYKGVIVELLPRFEQANQYKVVTRFSSSPDILKRTQAGENVDVVILASDSLQTLIQSGKLVQGSRVGPSQVGHRRGSAGRRAKAGHQFERRREAGRARVQIRGLLRRSQRHLYRRSFPAPWNLRGGKESKSRQTLPGVAVGELIARGEVDLGFHQISELLPVAGIDIVGPLPPELQHVTVFSSGIHVAARDPAAARALIQFLASPVG